MSIDSSHSGASDGSPSKRSLVASLDMSFARPPSGSVSTYEVNPTTSSSSSKTKPRHSVLMLSLRAVTSRSLGHLIPWIPTLIYWLRDSAGSNAGSLLVESRANDIMVVDSLLRKFIDALNFSSDLTVNQIRELGEGTTVQIWASMLRKILLDAEPSVIPTSIGQELIALVMASKDHSIPTLEMKRVLDNLTRTQFQAVGELFALFRDTLDSDVSHLVGVRLITNGGKYGEESVKYAHLVVDELMKNCLVYFGRSASPCNLAEYSCLGDTGFREPQKHLHHGGGSFSYLPTVSVEVALMSARRHALKAFFQWNEESYVGVVDQLFKLHTFREIAWGVMNMYENLPGGWRLELEELKLMGEADFAWVPMESEGNKPLCALQPEDDSGSKSKLLAKVNSIRGQGNVTSSLNMVINEILDSEMKYYGTLKDLHDGYVSQIRKIASEGGAKQLGISLANIENVFGWRLAQVIETSKQLLVQLAVVNIVRNDISDFPGGRAMFVANAFALIAPDLSTSYAPFISGHRHGMGVLNKATQDGGSREASSFGALVKSKSFFKKKMPLISAAATSLAKQTEVTAVDNPTMAPFLSLWEELRESSKHLSGQSLQSIMIMPIQRIPRYKLLLQELEKKLPVNHPALSTLSTALEQISSVAQQVNQALRQHEKLENLVGAGDMPEIKGAQLTNKHQSFKLAVTYKTKQSDLNE